jgi:hypothetical protein
VREALFSGTDCPRIKQHQASANVHSNELYSDRGAPAEASSRNGEALNIGSMSIKELAALRRMQYEAACEDKGSQVPVVRD